MNLEEPMVPWRPIPPARDTSRGETGHSLGRSGHMLALFALQLAPVAANALHASNIARNATPRLGGRNSSWCISVKTTSVIQGGVRSTEGDFLRKNLDDDWLGTPSVCPGRLSSLWTTREGS